MKRSRLTLWWCGFVMLAVGAASGCRHDSGREALELKNQLRVARMARLVDLEAYVKSGMFPHNHDVTGGREPYLIDRHGRLCAVAYLVASSEIPDFQYGTFVNANNRATWGYSSGGNYLYDIDGKPPGAEELTRRREAQQRMAAIEKTDREFASKLLRDAAGNNHLRLKDLDGGPLMDWVLKSGLTLEECALIQPGYSYLSCNDCLPGSEETEGGACNRPPGETETTQQIRAVSFGRATSESQEIAKADQTRIRKHLNSVLEKLRADTEPSLDLAVKRLVRK